MGYTYPLQTNAALYGPQTYAGGAVVWVGNRSGLPAGDGSTPQYPLSSVFGSSGAVAKMASLNKAANRADAVGGLIKVLPGHVESIAASTSLTTLGGSTLTNVNIVGLGNGLQRPTFNWTATASALLVNQAGFWFRNLFFNLNKTAATTVTAAITTSAADCGFDEVEMLTSTSATQLTTTAITVASGSTRMTFNKCNINGATAATNPTDIITTTAAVDQFTMRDCKIIAGVNATTSGVVNLANAPTDVEITRCLFNNRKASSTKCFVASNNTTGSMMNCFGLIQTTGAATAFGTLGNLALFECYGATLTTAGILIGTPAT